jgi:hypothetical protein
MVGLVALHGDQEWQDEAKITAAVLKNMTQTANAAENYTANG